MLVVSMIVDVVAAGLGWSRGSAGPIVQEGVRDKSIIRALIRLHLAASSSKMSDTPPLNNIATMSWLQRQQYLVICLCMCLVP